VALQVMAAIITRLLIGFSFPGALELLIVVLVALTWGAGPSLFATLLGVTLEEFVVLPVRVGEVGATTGDLVEVVLFLAIGISISLVASASEQSRRRAVKERAEAQERELAAMRQVQERMDAFLAIASHDLRAPVTATIGFIDVAARRGERLAAAARDEKPDLVRQIETVRASIGDASRSSDRLTRMVNLLFDTSLARAGELKLQLAVCDLAALVRELVEGQRVSTPRRIIRLQMQSADPVWVMADPGRIGQVVTNYLANALKYSPSDQAVDVRLTVRGGCARVAVEDRGPGLPPSELERIWQRFYRVAGDSARAGARTTSGLGVGLHISKTIIELHGGKVGVESLVGRGSIFWFALPVDPPTT
jgi:signal transduction histidine kinase